MLIVADENIPLLDEFFADIGEIRRVAGRALNPADVEDADILLVRSVTRVDSALLADSRVKFVGTATIGTDHVDVPWLRSQGITFACAPGSNANSVVEYVLGTLMLEAGRRGLSDWSKLSVGIVGAGNVGGALWQRLKRLGFEVCACDPFLEQEDPEAGYVTLGQALDCDVITLHTPLTTEGEHPTCQLISAGVLAGLGAGQLLINTSRGEVIDEAALKQRLQETSAPSVVLDVWEREPRIDPELARHVWIATPHIAGYSLEGKIHGTEMIYRSLCRFLGLPTRKKSGQFLPEPALAKMAFTGAAQALPSAEVAMQACYDPRRDDARLRHTLRTEDAAERGRAFDALRRDYPVRREFSSVKIQLKGASRSQQEIFRELGFKLKL